MYKYEIVAKRHDDNEVVTHVKVKWNEGSEGIYAVEGIIKDIEDKERGYFTRYGNKTADVYVRSHPTTGKKFLISTADGITGNNIDNLPNC